MEAQKCKSGCGHYTTRKDGYCLRCVLDAKEMDEPVDPDDGPQTHPVECPGHYVWLTPQPIDILAQWNLRYQYAQAIKYIVRAEKSGKEVQDIDKAIFYLRHRRGIISGSII